MIAAEHYLADHGIDPELAASLGIEVAEETISYPYARPDGSVYHRTRHLAGDMAGRTMQPAGEALAIWWPGGRAGGAALLAEGEPDALAAHAAIQSADPAPAVLDGLTVAAIPGTGMPATRIAEELHDAGVEVAYVAMDGDPAGRAAAARIEPELHEAGIRSIVIDLPAEQDVCDLLVESERPSAALAELLTQRQRPAPTPDAKPDAQPVEDQGPPPDTGDLLGRIASTLRRFAVLSDSQRDVFAAWVLHTHAAEAADSTGYLHFSSPERESGKSRCLEVAAQLVPRPMEAANVSDAVMFRAMSGPDGPATLLYDEVDALFGRGASATKEEQRGLLNAGYRRGAVAWRCEGEGSNQTVTPYPVFGPKALAGIGELPETLASRCIPIRLRRRRPDEHVERGRLRTIRAACNPLRDEAARWASHNVGALEGAEPELPDSLGDRAQDICEPLVAIADLAGGEWPERIRAALVELHGDSSEEGPESWGVRLLADVQVAFGSEEELPTATLIARLKADEEAPWGSWGKGDAGLTPRGIAAQLKPYGIRSGDIHVDDDGERRTVKGYRREAFADAWDRYLTPDPPPVVHPSRAKRANGSTEPKTEDSHSRQEGGVARNENGRKPLCNTDGAAGAAEPHNGGELAATEAEEAEAERIAEKLGEGVV